MKLMQAIVLTISILVPLLSAFVLFIRVKEESEGFQFGASIVWSSLGLGMLLYGSYCLVADIHHYSPIDGRGPITGAQLVLVAGIILVTGLFWARSEYKKRLTKR